MCCVRGPSSSTGRVARERIDGQPEPEHLRGTAQPGAQLVQLEVRERELEEEALVQGVRVPTCTSEPPRNSGLSKAEDPLGGGRIEPFGQSREHHGDLVRGGFQALQGGVASGTACAVARLATKGLDRLSTPMLAVPDKRMEVSVSDAKVRALRVRTGEALSVYAFGCSPAAFHLRPGTRHLRALTLHPTKEWSRDDRKGSQAGCVA